MTDFPAVFDYEAQPKEWITVCNLCDKRTFGTPRPDRYGFKVYVATCPACGLCWLNRRMTADAYRQFYESGAYRRLVSAFHGREINAETLVPEQAEYAWHLVRLLPVDPDHGTLLDVGGSTGVVARHVGQHFGLYAAVLEPSPEIEQAEGLETIVGTIEDWNPQERKWDVILLCQTIDHLLDPMAALRKLRGCIAPDGILFVDIVDYAKTRAVKIDHPYNFTDTTMRAYLDRTGFKGVESSRAPDGVHIRYVARPA